VRYGEAVTAGTGATPSEEEVAARHRAAHDLSSPIRAIAIVSDLLAESLSAPDPDLDLIRTMSAQLVDLTVGATDRLAEFATELDG
jgi:hypothetical protein